MVPDKLPPLNEITDGRLENRLPLRFLNSQKSQITYLELAYLDDQF